MTAASNTYPARRLRARALTPSGEEDENEGQFKPASPKPHRPSLKDTSSTVRTLSASASCIASGPISDGDSPDVNADRNSSSSTTGGPPQSQTNPRPGPEPKSTRAETNALADIEQPLEDRSVCAGCEVLSGEHAASRLPVAGGRRGCGCGCGCGDEVPGHLQSHTSPKLS